jgi:quinol-cytochrome oxidoreductase complex cytochrome b subunit
MLRAVPNKLLGVITMFGAIALLFATPWLDTSKVRSMRYRPVVKWFFFAFILVTLALGWCGSLEPADVVLKLGSLPNGDPTGITVTTFSQFLAVYYYAYFLVVLPLLGITEKALKVPDNISMPVLKGGSAAILAGAAAQAEKKG